MAHLAKQPFPPVGGKKKKAAARKGWMSALEKRERKRVAEKRIEAWNKTQYPYLTSFIVRHQLLPESLLHLAPELAEKQAKEYFRLIASRAKLHEKWEEEEKREMEGDEEDKKEKEGEVKSAKKEGEEEVEGEKRKEEEEKKEKENRKKKEEKKEQGEEEKEDNDEDEDEEESSGGSKPEIVNDLVFDSDTEEGQLPFAPPITEAIFRLREECFMMTQKEENVLYFRDGALLLAAQTILHHKERNDELQAIRGVLSDDETDRLEIPVQVFRERMGEQWHDLSEQEINRLLNEMLSYHQKQQQIEDVEEFLIELLRLLHPVTIYTASYIDMHRERFRPLAWPLFQAYLGEITGKT